MWRLVALCFIVVATGGEPARAATAIGKIDRVQGPCDGTVNDNVSILAADAPIYLNEVVETGPNARLALSLEDGTALTIGENANLSIDDFVFQPAGANRLHLAVAGAFRFVSGKFGGGATRQASVTTPSAVIGVRGTDFWGGPIDGHFGVVLFEGAITVTTPGGQTELRDVGQGTDVTTPGEAPGAAARWAPARVDRAIATVTFR